MKKILLTGLMSLSILTSNLLAEEGNKYNLKDSVYFGIYGGLGNNKVELADSKLDFQGANVELRAGFEKSETHRFSLFLNSQLETEQTLASLSTEISSYTLGLNYDFQIKNLDTGTALFFGPSIFLVSATISQGSISENSLGGGAGLRVGVSQKISEKIDLEVYYQADRLSMDIEGVDMSERNKLMGGLSFKF